MTDVFSLFVDNLTVLDCALWDIALGPVGMSWRVGIEFIGQLNKEEVVFDFSLAKKAAKKIIDETADHNLIVPANELNTTGVNFWISGRGFVYSAPPQAFFPVTQVSKSCIKSTLENKIFDICVKDCENLKGVILHLEDQNYNDQESFYYQYTHGLPQHFGNCQRLMHGHKSTIKIFVNGNRSSFYEKIVADLFAHAHIVCSSYLTTSENKNVIEYTSSQGTFKLTLPPERCIILPYETTVENISKYLAHWLKTEHPDLVDATLVVKAYEGIDKGSSYTLVAGNHIPIRPYTPQKLELLKG